MLPARSAYVKLELRRARMRMASFHSASDFARIMRRNCSPARYSPSIAARQHVDLAAVAPDHRAERRPPRLARLGREPGAVPVLDRRELALERHATSRRAGSDRRSRRIDVERVDLPRSGSLFVVDQPRSLLKPPITPNGPPMRKSP